ncbi:hypothetical protein TeGR_g12 [Tetraparma gracilis]|uniref:ABC transporter domain-containing protein n=1 Tax=Tetraparma gracilis TaxID=2962635 RepID=A0ABQ6M782_9STRA|nr:hypothetical protein TeGR_g12 [Tetraparma gracilis]
MASGFGVNYPLYGVQVGDTSSVYSSQELPMQLHNPSPTFHGLMNTIAQYTSAGFDSAKVAVVPKTDDDDGLTGAAGDYFDYLTNQLDHYGVSTDNLIQFDSEAELEAYVASDDYDLPDNFADKIAFAFIINDVDPESNSYDYTIRSNYTLPWETRFTTVACLGPYGNCGVPSSASSTGTQEYFTMPSTTTFVDDVNIPQVSSYYYGYAMTGFLTLQKTADEYFLSLGESGDGDADYAIRDSGLPTVYTNVSMSMFPTDPYEANNFQQTIASLLPIFYMLAFLYPFSRFIRGLVLEKETKIKEGMKIMGLSDVAYGLSWLITLTIQGVITCLLILLVTRSTVFEFSDDMPIFLYFMTFSMSVIMFSFLLATFFSHSKTAAIMGTLLFFATYFPFYAVSDPTMSLLPKLLCSLFSPTAFALGAGVLADLETGQVFKTTGEDRVAVDSLNLDLFEGQITVLLGHNGAGKSTTISMLTGLINSTSGDAIVKGKKITEAMPEIRKSMGVCPQHDVLFPDLTVAQHLRMFAIFKDVPSAGLEAEVQKIINEVGLTEKRDVASSQLSGGMKRKLSLGIALIGDSKVVVLDEPTSGMDPYSRRSTWNILQKNKAGRIILLTTHFMDEADILGDRIAIMAHGQLKCVGSSMFLKNQYGVGYTFTVVKERGANAQNAEAIDKVVKSFVPAAEALSMVGSEQSYRLPFDASGGFVGLFESLESDKEQLCVSSYGISVTTLEEVFIRVGKGTEDEEDRQHLSTIRQSSAAAAPPNLAGADSAAGRIGDKGKNKNKEEASEKRQVSFADDDGTAGLLMDNEDVGQAFLSSSGRVSEKRVFLTHTRALLKKRLIYGMRDKKSFCFQLVIPTILVLLGMILLTVRSNADQPSIVLADAAAQFNPKMSEGLRNPVLVYVENDNAVAASVASYLSSDNGGEKSTSFTDITADAIATDDQFYGCAQGADVLHSVSNYLIEGGGDDQLASEKGASRYGAVTFADEGTDDNSFAYNLMLNASAIHGAGIYMNLVNSAALRHVVGSSDARITARNHPLPKTLKETNATQTADAFTAALMVMIAFCFLPASYAIFVVKEREVKAKHQQVISGVSIYAYWFSTFVWDATSYLAPFSLTLILIWCFGIEAYTKGDGAIGCALLFLLFGPAVAAFTYISTYLFKSHSTAQNIILFQNFLTGLCLMITSFILGLFESTRLINMKLKYLYRLFPGFCLGDGLIQLTLCNDNKCPVLTKDGYSPVDTQGVFAWDVVGGDLVFLALEIVVYMFITFAIEYTLTFPGVLSCFSRLTVKDPGVSLTDTEIDDEDVARERERVAGGGASGEVVVLNGLRKVYPASTGPKVAVQNLSFGIPTGECFGFLGINGAGKTTTLSILSGEFPPTAGDAWIAGFDIQGDQSLIRRKIGYCPQFDALLELLTVEEHLDLYSRIKGVAVAKQAQVVQKIMKEMDLLDFANKAAGSLSGGNKRKLSVAIAMIGGPSIVFLDEPSTGMDPVARRFMWDVISNMSTKEGRCSVILTTHSMEEAEALCSRIGIMVNGRLRCLGSGQHLKVRYGGGFEVDVKIQKVPAEAILDAFTLLARKSALPVAAYTNVPDLIIERLGNKGADKIYSSEQEAVSVLSTLAGVRMGVETLGSVCAVLGKARRADEISELGSGSVLYDMNRISGSIQLEAFLEWYLLEDVFEKLSRFLGTSFAEVKMLERSTMSSCRYQVAGIAAGGKGGT